MEKMDSAESGYMLKEERPFVLIGDSQENKWFCNEIVFYSESKSSTILSQLEDSLSLNAT